MTFFRHLLSIVSSQEMTIKHLMYTRKVPFLYTERACVLFVWFSNSPRKIFNVNQSVASILDQREYLIKIILWIFCVIASIKLLVEKRSLHCFLSIGLRPIFQQWTIPHHLQAKTTLIQFTPKMVEN